MKENTTQGETRTLKTLTLNQVPIPIRLLGHFVYSHEKLSEGSQSIDPPLGSDSHSQSVPCELPVREPLTT